MNRFSCLVALLLLAIPVSGQDAARNPSPNSADPRFSGITVLGGVKNPGLFKTQANRPLNLLQALALAGGLDSTAGTKILVTRIEIRAGRQVPAPVKSVEVSEVLANPQRSDLNIALAAGDTVWVTRKDR